MAAIDRGETFGAEPVPNGPAVAAMLAAGLGAFAMGIFYLLGDKSPRVNASMSLYRPSGALSGVSTAAIAVWLLAWLLLWMRWKRSHLRVDPYVWAALILLFLGVLLTFPPAMRLL